MNIKKTVVVDVITDTEIGRSIVNICFPTDKPLNVRESAHMLAAGISMLIRSCDNNKMGIKSHELMKEVIDHLNNEYISVDSYSDANADPIMEVK